jgi:hypothetical protein
MRVDAAASPPRQVPQCPWKLREPEAIAAYGAVGVTQLLAHSE